MVRRSIIISSDFSCLEDVDPKPCAIRIANDCTLKKKTQAHCKETRVRAAWWGPQFLFGQKMCFISRQCGRGKNEVMQMSVVLEK